MSNYDKLQEKLTEMFQLNRADLDFGIYRIMNSKRDEILRFMENDLLPQVKTVLTQAQGDIGSAGAEELRTLENQIRAAGMNPDDSPKVRELRAKYSGSGDLGALEQEVFNHLYSFFRRYYDEGDFLSLRRYKEGVYAIPYEGEEVKLHWANADQYYIKTAEHFRDYTFLVGNGGQEEGERGGKRRVHFKLVDAQTERDNNKEQEKRVFILTGEHPVTEEGGELIIRFEYRNDPAKRKQKDLTEIAEKTILAAAPAEWQALLKAKAPTEKDPNRTILVKHLTGYTARYTFDYFIHKDLGGFLRRELDFYIKNEVMHLDDIENEAAPKVEQYLAKVRAIRRVASKIIDFLAQLEDFQKRLWLKKKFVVESSYLVTLDHVPEKLYPEIVANAEQLKEWVQLLGIDQIPGDLIQPGFTEPLTVEFLKAQPSLPVDTRYFSSEFTTNLLSDMGVIDDLIDGILINADNFQCLSLLHARFARTIKCVTIDPPYNRQNDHFPYKDNYQHASWMSMMRDRLALARPLMQPLSALYSNIDENERDNLQAILDMVFGRENRIEELIWAQNTTHSQSPLFSTNHEYIEVYARDKLLAEQSPAMFREPKPGWAEISVLVNELNERYAPLDEVEQALKGLYSAHLAEYKRELEEQGLIWDEETQKQDPWRGIYNYKHAEYRSSTEELIPANEAKAKSAKLCIWREDNPSAPAQKQAESTRNANDINFRFYRPVHPINGKECPHPKTGWRWPLSWHDDSRDSFEKLSRVERIVWGDDETKIPQYKRFLYDVETNVAKSFFHDYTDGEKQIANLFGVAGLFPTPKPTSVGPHYPVKNWV